MPKSLADPRVNTLARRVAFAKAHGQKQITFPVIPQLTPEVDSLVAAASKYSVIIATPVAKYTVTDAMDISTWYALDIEKTIVERPPVATTDLRISALSRSEKPVALLPINTGARILLLTRGGNATINGVSLVQRGVGEQDLQLNKRYLFIVDISPDRLALLPLEMAGVFLIETKGDTLFPMTSKTHPVIDDVKSECFNSLSKIEEKIRPLTLR